MGWGKMGGGQAKHCCVKVTMQQFPWTPAKNNQYRSINLLYKPSTPFLANATLFIYFYFTDWYCDENIFFTYSILLGGCRVVWT